MSKAWQHDPKFTSFMPKVKLKEKGFAFIGEGRHRKVWKSPNGRYVLKFPLNDPGLKACKQEECVYQGNAAGGEVEPSQAARCRMIKYMGLPCLLMEFVNELKLHSIDNYPKWVRRVDCWQVGYTLRGRLCAYDFSNV